MLGSTLPSGPIANPAGIITTLIAAGGPFPGHHCLRHADPGRGLFPRQGSLLVRSRIQLSRVPQAARARFVSWRPVTLWELASAGGVPNRLDQEADVAFVDAGDCVAEADGRPVGEAGCQS